MAGNQVNNYDSVAGYYDLLSRLVYGRAEVNAQVELLKRLSPGNHLLIVGGGTGWVLEELAKLFPMGMRIVYVESSEKMMQKAKKRRCGKNAVEFVSMPVEDWKSDEAFDAILTGFFFDNFSEEHAAAILHALDPRLKKGGYWLNADFYCPKGWRRWWQRFLLRSMYIMTRILCKVEADRLPDMEKLFWEATYKKLQTTYYYQQFIQAVVYQK